MGQNEYLKLIVTVNATTYMIITTTQTNKTTIKSTTNIIIKPCQITIHKNYETNRKTNDKKAKHENKQIRDLFGVEARNTGTRRRAIISNIKSFRCLLETL